MPGRPLTYGCVVKPPPLQEAARLVAAVERNAFDVLGMGDSSTLWRDPYVVLAAAAQASTSVRLGPLVTNPVTRHPITTANSMASISDVVGKRAFLGIGVGDNAVLNVGGRPATLDALADAVGAIRTAARGEAGELGGRAFAGSWSRTEFPIVIAAEGPRMLRLAGAIGDGVIVGGGLSAATVSDSIGIVAKGAESVGRRLEDVEVWVMARLALGADGAAATAGIGSLLASAGHHALRDPARKGVPADLVPAVEQLISRYEPKYHTAPGHSPNAALIEELGLVDYLANRFAIVGSPEDCADRAEALRQIGVTTVVFVLADGTDAAVSQLDEIGPALAARRAAAAG
jgi:5,10-methylenetetrahydromethanopterin reductase